MEENKQPSIFKLKKQYKRLFLIRIKEYDIMFRLLTWGEMKLVRSFMTKNIELQNAILDDIFDECVLDHNIEDIDNINAGIVNTVSNLIITLSSYSDAEQFTAMISNAREGTMLLEGQIEMILSQAFHYPISNIDDMLVSDVMIEFAKAERVLTGIGFPDMPFAIDDGKQKPNKQTITKASPVKIPDNIPTSRQVSNPVSTVPPEGRKPFIVDVDAENRALMEALEDDE